jgi:hypothetical protein
MREMILENIKKVCWCLSPRVFAPARNEGMEHFLRRAKYHLLWNVATTIVILVTTCFATLMATKYISEAKTARLERAEISAVVLEKSAAAYRWK